MRLLALSVLLAIGCGGPDRPADAAVRDAGGQTDAGGLDAGGVDAGADDDAGPARLTDGATHLIVVRTPGWDDPAGVLRRYRRGAAGWEPIGADVPILLGRSGLGWGRGLHGDHGVAGLGGVDKQEGDGRSPAGLFRLGTTLGYAAEPPTGAVAPYVAMTPDLQCVEDTTSAHYNRIVDRATTAVDWTGDDRLRRTDGLYELLVFVEQNVEPAPVPGRGSCILLHVSSDRPTAGCTSMTLAALRELIVDLPEAGAMLVQLPEPAYASLREPWGLP